MRNPFRLITFCFLLLINLSSYAQVQLGGSESLIDYSNPKEYELGGVTVSGVQYLDESVLVTLIGLNIGDKYRVPGDKIAQSIENLWKQGLLSDIKVTVTKVVDNVIFLNYQIQERPRLSRFSFEGVSKGEADKLRDKLQLVKGKVVNENLIQMTSNQVKEYFIAKGHLFVTADVTSIRDSAMGPNSNLLTIKVGNKHKVKINAITFHGNKEFESNHLKHKMKGSKESAFWKIFTASKYTDDAYDKDKEKILALYESKGFRDAKIVKDSIYKFNDDRVNIDIWMNEGNKYYFRNITWVGNTKYSYSQLNAILGINKGDIYNQQKLEESLFMNQSNRDVSSLYMDDGYLFFQVTPVEVMVENDSIDLEMRIYEGKQAVISKVTVTGNTKTNDKVVMREIRTRPGQLFNRSDIIRTQRDLSQLGYFDQEKLSVNPKPNAADGTVDIEYVVEEKPSDQLELSGGWGGGAGIVGTLGVSFNNFSLRNIGKRDSWAPLPSGDGQKLSIRFQSNGKFYQSYNASFTEPWLGGKKPNSFSVSIYNSIQTNGVSKSDIGRQELNIIGTSVGLGRRLTFPDDYFNVYNEVSLQQYKLQNWSSGFLFSNGISNNLSLQQTLSRNSVDGTIWIRSGSQVSVSLQLTPPFSLMGNKDIDYKNASQQVKYKWIEYHKWKFSGAWYKSVGSKFVLFSRAQVGILGYYNKDIGPSPFERFYLGGDGLSGFSLDGREIIALRGYENNSVTPRLLVPNSTGTSSSLETVGGTAYDKYTMELRYPVSLNPSATIYVLGFLEGGNNYLGVKNFNPSILKRSAGMGVRIFLPMFGLLGLDWGYGFDKVENQPGAGGAHFHFTIGQQF